MWQFQLTIFISLNYHCSFRSSSILSVFFLDFKNLKKQNSRVLDVRLWFEFASNCNEYSVFIVSLYCELFKFRFVTTQSCLTCMYGATYYVYWYIYMCAWIDVCKNVFCISDRPLENGLCFHTLYPQALFVVTKLQ